MSACGSSPLARGLHECLRFPDSTRGIIPARAGFTPFWSTTQPSTADHPRSRGVYTVTVLSGVLDVGSSPLARGLPADLEQLCEVAGIIPARAGFTRDPGGRAGRGSDHPRSRGVYPASMRS